MELVENGFFVFHQFQWFPQPVLGLGGRGGKGFSAMETESDQRRIERHDALVLPWIRLWRRMGFGPDSIAKLLEAEGIQPPRSKWSANAVRQIGERQGITWRGLRSFVRGGIEAGRQAAARESLPRSLAEVRTSSVRRSGY